MKFLPFKRPGGGEMTINVAAICHLSRYPVQLGDGTVREGTQIWLSPKVADRLVVDEPYEAARDRILAAVATGPELAELSPSLGGIRAAGED